MKDAIGSSLVLSIIVTFLSVVLLVLVSSIVYTKAFRVKNRIIDIIETSETYNETTKQQIDKVLREIGYKANPYRDNTKCNNYTPSNDLADDTPLVNSSSLYHYCVFKLNTDKQEGYYYKVVTFAYLDLPLVNFIQIPVYGETRIFYID